MLMDLSRKHFTKIEVDKVVILARGPTIRSRTRARSRISATPKSWPNAELTSATSPHGVGSRSPPRARRIWTRGLLASNLRRIYPIGSLGSANSINGENSVEMCLKVMAVASAAVLLSLVCMDSAGAADGCGPGFHRGPYGRCHPNGPVVVAPAAPVVVAPAVVAPAAPAVVAPAVVAPAVVAPVPVVCGRGYRWHPGFRRCVVL